MSRFKILKTEGRARRGVFSTVHGDIQTPVFMNVGTSAAIKGGVSTFDLENLKCQVELSNTYHLHVRPGEDVVWVSSIEEAISEITDAENTFLIGGASIYEQMIDYCSEAYVTVIEDDKMGDSFFPNLDSREGWELYETSEQFEENGITYRFCKYKNNNVKSFFNKSHMSFRNFIISQILNK
jgi:tRNA-guanine family transglycosylase